MKTDAEKIAIAQAYVALSNGHQADVIHAMLAESACYESTAVGRHIGREAICDMMREFFSRYPDVSWLADRYRANVDSVNRDSVDEGGTRGAGSVTFNFNMSARDPSSGTAIHRSGIEEIAFDDRGFVMRIVVQAT